MSAPERTLPDDVEGQVAQWRRFVSGRRTISPPDVEELEDHLRERIHDLLEVGLDADEAFLVAVRRMGALDEVSGEFAREHSERLWKQLVLPAGRTDGETGRHELVAVLALACAAALALQLPDLIGVRSFEDHPGFYARNLSLFVLPFLAGYFAWKRRMRAAAALAVLAPGFVVGALAANALPLDGDAAVEPLVAIHVPVALWLWTGLAYVGGEWRSHRRRMDFVRFTGEWAVYYALLALGGGALVGLTAAGFTALGMDVETVVGQRIVPCGAMGAVIVAAWLVEAKQSVVENIAPVLTRVFTPLTTLMLLAFLVAIPARGDLVEADRDLLILVDLILVLVLGLVLYALSARDPRSEPEPFDWLQVVLVCAALAVDALMLAAMLSRVAEFGVSPNKLAALGLNLVLLVNLAWAARLSIGFLGRRLALHRLERWQTGYLPVYAAWAAVVAVGFPLIWGR